jgi:hypothetical protein
MTTEQAQAKVIEIQEEMIKLLKAEVARLNANLNQPIYITPQPYQGPNQINPNPFVPGGAGNPGLPGYPFITINGSGGAGVSTNEGIVANPQTVTLNGGVQWNSYPSAQNYSENAIMHDNVMTTFHNQPTMDEMDARVYMAMQESRP